MSETFLEKVLKDLVSVQQMLENPPLANESQKNDGDDDDNNNVELRRREYEGRLAPVLKSFSQHLSGIGYHTYRMYDDTEEEERAAYDPLLVEHLDRLVPTVLHNYEFMDSWSLLSQQSDEKDLSTKAEMMQSIILNGFRIQNRGNDLILFTRCLRVLGSSKFTFRQRLSALRLLSFMVGQRGEVFRAVNPEFLQNFQAASSILSTFLGGVIDVDSIMNTITVVKGENVTPPDFMAAVLKHQEEGFEDNLAGRSQNHDQILRDILFHSHLVVNKLFCEISQRDDGAEIQEWMSSVEKLELQLHALLLKIVHTPKSSDFIWVILCNNMWTTALWHNDEVEAKASSKWAPFIWKSLLSTDFLLAPNFPLDLLFRRLVLEIRRDYAQSRSETSSSIDIINPYHVFGLSTTARGGRLREDLSQILFTLLAEMEKKGPPLEWLDEGTSGWSSFPFLAVLVCTPQWRNLLRTLSAISPDRKETPFKVPFARFDLIRFYFYGCKGDRLLLHQPDSLYKEWAQISFENAGSWMDKLLVISFFLDLIPGKRSTLAPLLLPKVLSPKVSDNFEEGGPLLLAVAVLYTEVGKGKPKSYQYELLKRVEGLYNEGRSRLQSYRRDNSNKVVGGLERWNLFALNYARLSLAERLVQEFTSVQKIDDEYLRLAANILINPAMPKSIYLLLRNDDRVRAMTLASEKNRSCLLDVITEMHSSSNQRYSLLERGFLLQPLVDIACGSSYPQDDRKPDELFLPFLQSSHSSGNRSDAEQGSTNTDDSFSSLRCLLDSTVDLLDDFVEFFHQGTKTFSGDSDFDEEARPLGELVAEILTALLGQHERRNQSTNECNLPQSFMEYIIHESRKRSSSAQNITSFTESALCALKLFSCKMERYSMWDDNSPSDYSRKVEYLRGDHCWYSNWCLGFLPIITHESFPDRISLTYQDCIQIFESDGRQMEYRTFTRHCLKRALTGLIVLLKECESGIDFSHIGKKLISFDSEDFLHPGFEEEEDDVDVTLELEELMSLLEVVARNNGGKSVVDFMFTEGWPLIIQFTPFLLSYFQEIISTSVKWFSGAMRNDLSRLRNQYSEDQEDESALRFPDGIQLEGLELRLAAYCSVYQEDLELEDCLESILCGFWRHGSCRGFTSLHQKMWSDYVNGKLKFEKKSNWLRYDHVRFTIKRRIANAGITYVMASWLKYLTDAGIAQEECRETTGDQPLIQSFEDLELLFATYLLEVDCRYNSDHHRYERAEEVESLSDFKIELNKAEDCFASILIRKRMAADGENNENTGPSKSVWATLMRITESIGNRISEAEKQGRKFEEGRSSHYSTDEPSSKRQRTESK